uniref:Autophagy protein 5 n=1 Tax=Parascaris univalens TaxID=6257 RepID=A0A914ZKK4_PARUN
PQDYEVTRKLWDGRIPVQFILDNSEFLQSSAKPFCAMIPRLSYFPLALPRVLQYFTTIVEQIDPESVWLQYNGQPLKWHYPVGVLFDLLKSDDLLPWTITLRTKNFPKEVMRCAGDALESSFIQSIKEADQLKHKANIINSMKSDEHKQLWNGLVQDRFDEFWSINKKLMENTDSEAILHIPIRIYEANRPLRQVLIAPLDENGRRQTLDDVLRMIQADDGISAISHGILLPLETPLLWMAENFSYLDNFIHVVLIKSA